MMYERTTRDVYGMEQSALVRRACPYVATRQDGLLDETIGVGWPGPCPPMHQDQESKR